jgi:DNA-binding LytR/AlgR family response regulator
MEARKEYLMLYFTHQQVITHITMKAMEDVMPFPDFIRIHRSYNISKREVTGIASSFLEVAGKKLPIGEPIS